jgi:hypothetical protein
MFRLNFESVMAEPAPPLGNPLLGLDRLEQKEQVGHRTVTKEMIHDYVQHLEAKYAVFDENLESAPPNKWAKYGKGIIQAMQAECTLKEDEHRFLVTNMGYIFNEIMIDYMAEARSRLSIVPKRLSEEEIFGIQASFVDQECAKCKVGHVLNPLPTECYSNYGPYDVKRLKNNPLDTKDYAAMVVGTDALLLFYARAVPMFLNLGITDQDQLSFDKNRTGIADAVRDRIAILPKNCTMPILVEFRYDYLSAESLPTQMHLMISSLAQVQREYDGPIILLIPPYRVQEGDGWNDYAKGKRYHEYWEKMGTQLGQMLGLAVGSVLMQSEYRDENTVYNHASWTVEPLFNEKRQCTREYHRRMYGMLLNLCMYIHPWIVPVSKRQNCQKYKSQANLFGRLADIYSAGF